LSKILPILKNNKFLTLASLIFLALNIWNFFQGQPVVDEYDTPSYFEFSLYPSFRMQIVTGIYTILKNYYLIIGFQVLISVLSYVYLAKKLLDLFDNEIISKIAVVLIYVLANSSVIIEQNFILRSESLNNSALVILFGTMFGYVKDAGFSSFTKVCLAVIFLAGTRAVSSFSVFVFFIFFLIIFNGRTFLKRKYLIIGMITVGFNLFFVLTASSTNTSKVYTTSSIINERLWINPDWKDQIVEDGFPLQSRNIWIDYRASNKGLPPDQAVINSVEFKNWSNQGNENYLYRFMVKNLDYTFLGPVCLPCLNSDFTFRQTILSGWSQGTDEIRNNYSLQELFTTRTLFWPDKPEHAYIVVLFFFVFLVIISLIVMIDFNDKEFDILKIASLFLIYIFVYSYLSWWLGSKENDMSRHQLNSAIGIRILLVFTFLSFVDKIWDKLIKYRNIKI
jgi:hypothetical protein